MQVDNGEGKNLANPKRVPLCTNITMPFGMKKYRYYPKGILYHAINYKQSIAIL